MLFLLTLAGIVYIAGIAIAAIVYDQSIGKSLVWPVTFVKFFIADAAAEVKKFETPKPVATAPSVIPASPAVAAAGTATVSPDGSELDKKTT